MNIRNLASCSAMFALALHVSWATASDEKDAQAYMQYDVNQMEQPIQLDCIAKHGKYLPAISKSGVDEFKLASIDSRGPNAGGQSREGASRQAYSTLRKSYRVPDVSLITEQGERKDVLDVLDVDKPVMLNFIFTTCTTICPVLSASFTQVQEVLGDEKDKVSMVSITIDPEYDTVNKLSSYSQRFDAGPQWEFLTGKLKDVVAVEKAFDIYHGSKTNHEPATFIRAGKGKPWLRIDGLASANDIIAEYRNLIADNE